MLLEVATEDEYPLITGLLIVTPGKIVSIVKVELAEDAVALFPAKSVAVPAGMVMPMVPVPVKLDKDTVLVVPLPLTATLALAVPVLFKVTLPGTSVLLLKLVST